jgi:hypothetical protein
MTRREEGRTRWTDEMLDELADSVSQVKDSVSELRESVSEVKDSVDGVRVTAQALLQIATQQQRNMDEIRQRQEESDRRFEVLLQLNMDEMKQRQEESDRRFEVLLSEVRYLIRQIKPENSQSES